MQDISGFGLRIQVIASNTFPFGTVWTQFADDTDPFEIPSLQIADKAMGVNGDLCVWSKANPILLTIGLIPGGDDDINAGILLEANRVGRGKTGARDIITLIGMYPSGKTLTYNKGVITDGLPGNAVASAGRLKSKPYIFAFENKVGT